MAKPEWGVKRTCSSCGARFYDMRREPIICPKCEATVDPLAQLRTQRSKPVIVPVVEAPVAVVEEVELVDDDDLDDGTEIEEVEEEAEEEDVIEDASELGEDKDDMFEVMDKVNGDEEEPR